MARVICQSVDQSGNIFLLKDDGILEKRTILNVPIWSQQTKQEPTTGVFVYANQFVLDFVGDVWLTYADELNVVARSGVDGTVLQEVLSTAVSVITTSSDPLKLYAISSSRRLLHELSRTAKAIIRSFDLAVKIPNYNKDVFINQMTSSTTGKIYWGALVGGNVTVPGGAAAPTVAQLVKFDPVADGTFFCYAITNDVPIPAVSSDALNQIYASDLHGNVYRFSESGGFFDTFYQPPGAGGVVNVLTFTDAHELVLLDDGTFSFLGGKTRIMNPANGTLLSTVSSSNVGTVAGDPLGYHHRKITLFSVPPPPIAPIWDNTKVQAWVLANGEIDVTGRPGALTTATSVTAEIPGPIVLGVAVVNPDGSFSIKSAPGVGNTSGGDTVTLTATYGVQTTPLGILTVPRVVPASFTSDIQAPDVLQAGQPTRLKFVMKDPLDVPIVPATNLGWYARLKHDASGKYFNGVSFVPDNGDYLPLVHDFDGLWFVDVTLPTTHFGSATLYIKESPAVFTNVWLSQPIALETTLQSVKTTVEDLNSRVDVAFGAPALSFDDPNSIGGFVVGTLSTILRYTKRLYLLTNGSGQAVRVEAITADIDRQTVFANTTPIVNVIVYDEERRFPQDLSGARIFMNTKLALASSVFVFSREGTIVDAPNGMAEIHLTAQDTSVAQRLSGQIVVYLPGGVILASPAFFFDILPSAV